jgi:hypothetical protein
MARCNHCSCRSVRSRIHSGNHERFQHRARRCVHNWRPHRSRTPGNPDAYLRLADYSATTKRAPAALADYQHSLDLRPDQPAVLDGIAVLQWNAGNHSEALAAWSLAVKRLAEEMDARHVPETFWSDFERVLESIKAHDQFESVRQPVDAMLRIYVARNGDYRVEPLLKAGYRANGNSVDWLLNITAAASNQASVLYSIVPNSWSDRGPWIETGKLDKLVPSPYFRSYWVQRNITEMKQYRAALSDLHRGSDTYREDRILLRKPGINSAASGDVTSLLGLAPEDSVFSSAQASPDPYRVLAIVRENLLELKPVRQQASSAAAPAQVSSENVGSASMLEERIDVAPVIAAHSDAYQPLRALFVAAQPSAILQAFATRSAKDEMFVGIDSAVVLVSPSPWNESALQSAIAAALRPGLTASPLGIEWTQLSSANGTYSSLTGEVPLYMALQGNQLFLANRGSLLDVMLSRQKAARSSQSGPSLTYGAVFQHTPREQQTFRRLVDRLDSAGHSASNPDADPEDGQSPPFLSGNIAGLSRMFATVDRETVADRDEATQVTQTVLYYWRRP